MTTCPEDLQFYNIDKYIDKGSSKNLKIFQKYYFNMKIDTYGDALDI